MLKVVDRNIGLFSCSLKQVYYFLGYCAFTGSWGSTNNYHTGNRRINFLLFQFRCHLKPFRDAHPIFQYC